MRTVEELEAAIQAAGEASTCSHSSGRLLEGIILEIRDEENKSLHYGDRQRLKRLHASATDAAVNNFRDRCLALKPKKR